MREHESLPMFAVSRTLEPKFNHLDLNRHGENLASRGYTVLESAIDSGLVDSIRRDLISLIDRNRADFVGSNVNGASCDMLLASGSDSVISAVLDERVLALTEYMCGRNAVISHVSGSRRPMGDHSIEFHCDQDWLPAPFPSHTALITACWYLDDIADERAGATRVVPGSHLAGRHPDPADTVQYTAGEPILCSKGSVAIWDGRLWHSNYAREMPGTRIVLHVTYNRLAYRPLEDYSDHAAALITRYGARMGGLLGEPLWFGNRAFNRGGLDFARRDQTCAASRQ